MRTLSDFVTKLIATTVFIALSTGVSYFATTNIEHVFAEGYKYQYIIPLIVGAITLYVIVGHLFSAVTQVLNPSPYFLPGAIIGEGLTSLNATLICAFGFPGINIPKFENSMPFSEVFLSALAEAEGKTGGFVYDITTFLIFFVGCVALVVVLYGIYAKLAIKLDWPFPEEYAPNFIKERDERKDRKGIFYLEQLLRSRDDEIANLKQQLNDIQQSQMQGASLDDAFKDEMRQYWTKANKDLAAIRQTLLNMKSSKLGAANKPDDKIALLDAIVDPHREKQD